ncbi:MAG: hypothetical protein RSA12_11075, partial [Clostridia bacterium]
MDATMGDTKSIDTSEGIKMVTSAAKLMANLKYDVKTYCQINVKARKDERLPELVSLACSQNFGKSKNDYIIRAIRA